MKIPLPESAHPLLKLVYVVDALGLDELGTAGDFLGKAGYPHLKGIGKGVGRSPHKHFGRPFNIVAPQKLSVIPHVPHGLDQLHGIQIMNILALGTVPQSSDDPRKGTRYCEYQRRPPPEYHSAAPPGRDPWSPSEEWGRAPSVLNGYMRQGSSCGSWRSDCR